MNIKISLVEERSDDTWFDLSLRSLRSGEVRFYRVDDSLTGKWLFKVCSDKETAKVMVKAIKCPAGRLFSQLEGATMVFQQSVIGDLFYDIVSLTHVDEAGRVRREVAKSLDEVPQNIKERFEVKNYDEATGKRILKSHLVTLIKKAAEKDMVTLFLLERAWTLPPSAFPPTKIPIAKEAGKAPNLMSIIRKLQKANVNEVRGRAQETLGIRSSDVDKLILDLKTEGRIRQVDSDFVKIGRQASRSFKTSSGLNSSFDRTEASST